MAHDSPPKPAKQQQHADVTQDHLDATESDASASTPQKTDKTAQEDYAEFLQTQHFFNDTATYSTQDYLPHNVLPDEAEEDHDQFFPVEQIWEEVEPTPIVPVSSEEPDVPIDLLSFTGMSKAPPTESPLPTEDAVAAEKEDASPFIPTSLQAPENAHEMPTHHELHDLPAAHNQEPETDQLDWKVGDIIDTRYEVTAIIGRGGMGIVYRVHHREWDLDMAVKMPLLHLVANQALKARFVLEAQTWIDLGVHPNIVQCWYVREFENIPRVFMDYLTGGSLKDRIKQGYIQPDDWERILDVAIQACDGLGYAHEHGIKAHRDVKPANFLLAEDGELRVTDFGIAKRADHDEEGEQRVNLRVHGKQHTMTITGSDIGTPEYGAPEQWGKAKYADARADIYALGGILFEMCCGRRAFDDGQHREQPYAIIGRHLFSPVPDPRVFNPDVPPALADIIMRCLAKEPEDRPNSMHELREYQVDLYKKLVGKPYWKEVPQAAELRSSTLNNRAISLLDLGKRQEALEILDEALKLDAHHAESVYNKALLQWREEQIADDEVVRRLKEAIQINRRAGAYLGMIHLERGAVEQAEQALTDALQKPEVAKENMGWRVLGDALMAQEKYTQAIHAYQQALELLPGDNELKFRLALARQGPRNQEHQRLFPYPHCVRTFIGASDRIENLMLSSETRYALAASADNVKLWNLTTGEYLWTYTWSEEGRGVWTCKGYAGSRTCVAITPDSTFALSGSADEQTIRLWNLETGECVRQFAGHSAEVSALAILPDGRHVLSGSLDTTLRLWEIPSGQCLRVFEGCREPVTALTVTPDGEYALFGSANFVRQLDLATGRLVRTFRGHGDDITGIVITPNQNRVISGSRDKNLRIWTLVSGRCLHTLAGHTDGITALDLTPDGLFAVSASLDKQLRVWDLHQKACVNILQGHTSHITAVRVTPDGRFVFSISRDRTLRLWRLATGKCLRIFPEFTHWLEALMLTPDGQYALFGNSEELRFKHLPSQTYKQVLVRPTQYAFSSAASDAEAEHTVRLHNLPPGENFLTLIGRSEEKTYTVATPSGTIGISAGADETLYAWAVEAEHKQRIWGMRGPRGLQVFKAHRGILRTLATTPDGKLAVTGGEDGKARLWELPAATCVQVYDGHRRSIHAVTLTPDARYVLTGSSDTTVRLWNRETGACINVFTGHDDTVTAVAITPDGQFAVSGSSDKTLRLWNLTTGKCLRTFEGHDDAIPAVAITPDAQYALSVTNGRILRLWRLDARIPRQQAVFQVCRHVGHRELEVFQKRFRRFLSRAENSRKAGNIATAYTFLTLARSIPGYERDPDALAVNAALNEHLDKKALRGGRLLHAFTGHKRTITAVATSIDGRFILSGSQDKTFQVRGLATGQHFRTFSGHTDLISSVSITPDRHLAVTGSHDNSLRVWAVATGECLKVLTGHQEYVTSVAVSSDSRLAVSGSRDKTLRLWILAQEAHDDIADGMQRSVEDAYRSAERATDKSVQVFKGHAEAVETVAIAGNGQFIISGSQDKTLRLWEISTGRCTHIFRGHSGYITDVALSPDGQFAVSASRDHTLRVWRIASGMCLRILRGHDAYVSSVAVTADGRFAVSGSWDRTVRLWKLDSGECLRVFERHEGQVEAIAVTPDGHFVVSGGRDATLRVWEFDWELSPKKSSPQ